MSETTSGTGRRPSAVPILPWVVHEGIEYLAGLFLIAAPFLFGFDDEPLQLALSIIAGIVILAVAVLSRGPAAVANVLPTRFHATLDYVIAFFFLIAGLLFLLAEATPVAYVFLALGAAHLVISLITDFPTDDAEAPTS